MPARSWGCAQVWSKVRSLGRDLNNTLLLKVFSVGVQLGEVGQTGFPTFWKAGWVDGEGIQLNISITEKLISLLFHLI